MKSNLNNSTIQTPNPYTKEMVYDQGQNVNLPDNVFRLNISNAKCGDMSQDLSAMCLILMAHEIGLEIFEKEMKSKEKRKNYITRFANSRGKNKYLKMLLKHLVAGEQAQVTNKKLKLAVDAMILETQAVV